MTAEAAVPNLARSLRVTERNALIYRKFWIIFVVTFLEPVFYLLSLGLGLGQLVGDLQVDGRTLSYATFVAPALMATSAMNGAFFDMSFNFFYKLKYAKTFDAILNTPLTMTEILVGEILWAVIRAGIYAAGFLAFMTIMGLVASWWALLAVPAALFVGLAFASIGAMFSSLIRSWHDFDLIQLILQPLFLCSATFFPLDVYPPWAQPIVWLSPLFHGVTLIRDLILGTVGWHDLGHAALLLVVGLAAAWVSRRRLVQILIA